MTLASVALSLPDDEATTVWHGRKVTRVDPVTASPCLDSGERLDYDALLVATGADPRPLGIAQAPEAVDRIVVLRTAADALALRAALFRAARERGDLPVRVAVVGAGLLGAETADTLATEGAVVTLIDPDPTPLDRLLGETVGGWVRAQQRGPLRPAFAMSVLGVEELGGAVLLRLSDGSRTVADVVLVSAGVTPASGLLAGVVPDVRTGLPTDDRLRVAGGERIYAAGDVAHVHRGQRIVRSEHWGQALAQGRHAARVILHDLALGADPGPFVAPESFATRLHGKAITVLGRPGPDVREVVLAGSPEDDAVTVGLVDRDDRLVGAVALGSPRTLNKLRSLVSARRTVSEARAGPGRASRLDGLGDAVSDLEVIVEGMRCRRCVREVTARLRDVPGVRTVVANARTSRVRLGGTMSIDHVRAALAGTSYAVHVVEGQPTPPTST